MAANPYGDAQTSLEETIAVAREDVLERILLGSALATFIGMAVRMFTADFMGILMYGGAAVAFYALRSRSPWGLKTRALSFLSLLYLFTLLSFSRSGLSAASLLLFVLLPPLAILLVSLRAGIVAVVLVALAWLGAGIVFDVMNIPSLLPPADLSQNWLYNGVDLLWAILVLFLVQQQFREKQDYLLAVGQQKGNQQEISSELGQRTKQLDKATQRADQRHLQQLTMLAEVGRAVTSSLDLQDQLRVLVELLQSSFDLYGVNVWMLTEPPDTVQLKAGYGPSGEDLSQLEVQLFMDLENSIVSVCKTGIYHLDNSLRGGGSLALHEHFASAGSQLVLPLQIAGKLVGALELLDEQADAFNQEDVILLRSLADQVTMSIRNATLYQAERSRRYLAETLYEVGLALSRTLKLDEVLEMILEQLDKIVPTDRAAVMLMDKNVLQFVAARGFPETVRIDQLRVPLRNDSIYGQIFRTRKSLSIPDVLRQPDWQQMDELPQARSWMGVPLIRADEVIGMLSLTRETLNPYSFSEATLAQTFAGQAAVALENARLYDNLERFNQQLEEMVAERTNQLRRAYDQLEELDQTKSNFIKLTSHELRTPLTVLSGYSQMMLQNPQVKNDPALMQLLEGIHSGSLRLHEIVGRMLDVAKVDSRALELSPEPLSLAYLFKSVIGGYEAALKQRKLTLEMDDLSVLPNIEADAGALHKVFYHLIGNAIKYTPDGGKITINGRVLTLDEEPPDSWVEIVISDTGIGIDPELQELIFIKFYQTGEIALHSSSQTQFKGGGPGLGLPIARGIIQAHQGRLWVESPGHDEANCPGSQFHVVLPVRQ